MTRQQYRQISPLVFFIFKIWIIFKVPKSYLWKRMFNHLQTSFKNEVLQNMQWSSWFGINIIHYRSTHTIHIYIYLSIHYETQPSTFHLYAKVLFILFLKLLLAITEYANINYILFFILLALFQLKTVFTFIWNAHTLHIDAIKWLQ